MSLHDSGFSNISVMPDLVNFGEAGFAAVTVAQAKVDFFRSLTSRLVIRRGLKLRWAVCKQWTTKAQPTRSFFTLSLQKLQFPRHCGLDLLLHKAGRASHGFLLLLRESNTRLVQAWRLTHESYFMEIVRPSRLRGASVRLPSNLRTMPFAFCSSIVPDSEVTEAPEEAGAYFPTISIGDLRL